MIYYLYKTVNQINNKEYIGVHHGELNDRYMGSGVLLKKAIKKYGRENFRKEILETFEEREKAFEREREIVTEDYVSMNHTYNVASGGCGGDLRSGLKCSDETRKKISEAAIKRNADPRFKEMLSRVHKGKKLTKENIEKTASKNRGKTRCEEFKRKCSERISGENNPMYGKVHSEDHKRLLSDKNKCLKWTWNPKTGEQLRRHKDESLPENWIYGRRPRDFTCSV